MRPAVPGDAAQLAAFLARTQPQFACFAPGHLRHGFGSPGEWLDGASLALSEDGELLGFAIVEPGDAAGEGRLAVLVPAMQHSPEVVSALLSAGAEAARRLGIRHLQTGVLRQQAVVMAAFDKAGLRALSSLNLGGLTELVLAVD